MVSKSLRGIVLTALTLGFMNVFAGATPVSAAPGETSGAPGLAAGAPYVPGRVGQTVCVAELFCAQVVAQLGNPPGTAAWQGITQATLTYAGYGFGPIFLAHVGTPEGWAFYDVKVGDRISVLWTDGGMSAYSVVSIRRYKLMGNGRMQDISTGRTKTNLQVYSLNQSDPNLSLETCIPNPEPAEGRGDQSLGTSTWGRMFIQAEAVSNW